MKNKRMMYLLCLVNLLFLLYALTSAVYADAQGHIKYNDQADEYQTVIGRTATDLLGGEIDGVSVCRIGETNLGDLIADALRQSASETVRGTEHEMLPVVSIQNGGGIRKTIPKGDITKNDIKEVLPYYNRLVIHMVTPNELYHVLENGVSRITNDKNGTVKATDGRFPQISGMRVIYDYSQPASNTTDDASADFGSRILAIYINGSEKALDRNDNDTEILLAFNNYCLDGGDGYTMLKGSNVIYQGDTVEQIVCKYISNLAAENNGIIEYQTSGRMLFGEGLGNLQKDIRVVLNAEPLQFDVAPIIENHRLLVPLRTVFEALEAQVLWDEEIQCVTIRKGNQLVTCIIGSDEIKINDSNIALDMPVKIVNDRALVSIAFIRNAIDANVEWDSKYNALFIDSQQ